VPAEAGQWWTDFLEGDAAARDALLAQGSGAGGSTPAAKRRRRRRKPTGGRGGQGGEGDTAGGPGESGASENHGKRLSSRQHGSEGAS
jgi:poly(A) polymerase